MLEFLKSLRGARDTRAALVAKLDKLATKRTEVVQRAPDRATVVAWFERSINAQADEYHARLTRWFFSPEAQSRLPGTYFETDSSIALLNVPSSVPFHGSTSAVAPNESLAPVAPVALAYFLRDKLLAEVPSLVDEFFPGAARGIAASDRAAALAKIDAETKAAEAELAELDAALDDARSVTA